MEFKDMDKLVILNRVIEIDKDPSKLTLNEIQDIKEIINEYQIKANIPEPTVIINGIDTEIPMKIFISESKESNKEDTIDTGLLEKFILSPDNIDILVEKLGVVLNNKTANLYIIEIREKLDWYDIDENGSLENILIYKKYNKETNEYCIEFQTANNYETSIFNGEEVRIYKDKITVSYKRIDELGYLEFGKEIITNIKEEIDLSPFIKKRFQF